ncbi:two-component system, LytT family, sensor histidine kinase LytS [Cohaesibacter marisflavi]|uniref:Two-component system, LytT family, sensor histidine kinase LytS n=1 Tax=Cohaesibacter marisflavi TaxID=655353 RepID=A0A1I5NHT0_9HYPH|nr:LytS/YhcK type 5TM receptor domain-containing protein [Cohaesibacter marisflavi]SFP20906.1 two-component system, LytT family, sensor histidine kinase LytS [Cohaesibacter marisflavi]
MSIVALMAFLLKQVALLVAGAFVLLTVSPVQEINFRQDSIFNRLFLILFFGFLGILGTYGGNEIFNSFANLRAMAVITAGLFGGPVVGLGAGLVAGGHRFLIDPWGFSALGCALATITEGFLAGWLQRHLKDRAMDWSVAFFLTIIGETMHMGMVLLLSRPFDDALALVRVIMLPMLIGNSLGTVLFVHILNSIKGLRERKASDHTQKIFEIANSTVSHLRSGLNGDSAQALARIILEKLPVAAVSVTNANTVIGHAGEGADHHLPGEPFVTKATFRVIKTGEPIFLKDPHLIGCSDPHCPFTSAIIVPLKKNDTIVGTLKFYGSAHLELNSVLFELAKGLTDLFSIQLELQDIQVKDRLLAHAEIRHLQAQINPHFLFNSLNTIASFCRTAPDRARDLILDLSLYMRKNLDSSRGFIRLSDELDQINSYLAIEKARFGERIQVKLDIEDGCEKWPIPSLIIQPLVENAVKHGLKERAGAGIVGLKIFQNHNQLHITVYDDGVGIPDNILVSLLEKRQIESHHEGIGLRNSNLRLEHIYGPEHGMQISTTPNKGTHISFSIPNRQELLPKAS